MPTVTADLEAVPSEEPGVYRFRTNLGMDGNWRLSVAAKIQAKVVKFAGGRWLPLIFKRDHTFPATTGNPAARHSGRPSIKRRALKPRARSITTAS